MKWGAAVETVRSVSPETTGCGCGVRVPQFASASDAHAHKLTVTELDDIRVADVEHKRWRAHGSGGVNTSGVNYSTPRGNSDYLPPSTSSSSAVEETSRALVVRKNKPSSTLAPFVISPATPNPTPEDSSPTANPIMNQQNLQQQQPQQQQPQQLPLSLECDYDVRPTELYKYIQAKNWQLVMELLETDKVIEASVWVVRKEPSGQLRWRLLPLHASIIFGAPYSVVEALLGVYPSAAAAKDDQGMLPLHLSLRNSPIDWSIVEELLTAHPAAVGTQDRKGRTPLQGSTTRTADPTLSVLKLYTQIAVARERSALMGGGGGTGDDNNSVASSSMQLPKLLELQQQVEHERDMWKKQIQAIEAAAQDKVDASLKIQHELQEQVALLQGQAAMASAVSPGPSEETELWKELCMRLIQQQEQALDLTWLQTVVEHQNRKNNEFVANLNEAQEQVRALMMMTPDTEVRKEDILTAMSRSNPPTTTTRAPALQAPPPHPPAFKITVESASHNNEYYSVSRPTMVEEKKEAPLMDQGRATMMMRMPPPNSPPGAAASTANHHSYHGSAGSSSGGGGGSPLRSRYHAQRQHNDGVSPLRSHHPSSPPQHYSHVSPSSRTHFQ